MYSPKTNMIKAIFVSLFIIQSTFVSLNAKADCVDFLTFADNTNLGNAFALNGFFFQSQPGAQSFVNVFTDMDGDQVHGAQFENDGMQVFLPSPSVQVDIEIGVFLRPGVRIRGLDNAGLVVDALGVPADNQIHNVTLTSVGNPIVLIQIRGGGNEAVVNEICNL